MNYWFGVISKSYSLADFECEKKWFCLPFTAKVGDYIVMYKTLSIAKKNSGICGIYKLIKREASCDGLCKSYGSFNGTLFYYELEAIKELKVPIPISVLKKNVILKKSQPIRRSAQGTVFELKVCEFSEREKIIK